MSVYRSSDSPEPNRLTGPEAQTSRAAKQALRDELAASDRSWLRSPRALRANETRLTEQLAQQVAQQQNQERAAANALLARDHELARMRALQIDGSTASGKLAAHLRFAHQQAGKPSLTALSHKVDCHKGTLSKVFNNKMHPPWRLVRRLGMALRVPQTYVMQELLPLWIAADTYRHSLKSDTVPMPTLPAPASAAAQNTGTQVPVGDGYPCSECGSWVVDAVRHTRWHMDQTPERYPASAAEPIGATRANTAEFDLLREALSTDE